MPLPARLRPAALAACAALAAAVPLLAWQSAGGPASPSAAPPASAYVHAASPVAAGRYLTIVGGCNDCHTERWGETDGKIPEAERLAGNPVGYRGPWGTTYAANLRMLTQRMTEDRWVQTLKTADGGDGSPPMPWMNTAQMSDRDLRAMYRYIRGLGPRGERMPRGVPPGQEPTTPYVSFTPVQPGGSTR
ncbi:MAG: hypothetical protein JWM27_216 [Gemmatimonadetes bacterium]|nr:hypothetical protein [Gemmatimonadota bacterium]